jgi:hypothetical protein
MERVPSSVPLHDLRKVFVSGDFCQCHERRLRTEESGLVVNVDGDIACILDKS